MSLRLDRGSAAAFILILTLGIAIGAAQAKKRAAPPRSVPAPATQTATPSPTPEPRRTPSKKNDRPVSTKEASPERRPSPKNYPFHYEFSQPDFPVARIVIEHDESGAGFIRFSKRGANEEFTDPLEVSAAALERINKAFDELEFLNSAEDYQYEKDYSHLGNVTITMRRDGRERTATFNWTINKNAKVLYDEYRKLANQFIWQFDMAVARDNQPLDSPRLMDSLDSLLKRNELSDPVQMLPLLTALSNNERLPLIARNHATRLIGRIERSKK
jgi:hypothetical protein